MSLELLQSDKEIEFSVTPTVLQSFEVTRKFQKEQEFIEKCLLEHPPEVVEDVSAVVHETNRIPDPRILLIKDGEILRLDGIHVDDSIEKNSYLGKLEYSAFEEIKIWAEKNNEGVEVWFSPPFPEELPKKDRFYPVSKTDFGEIRYSNDKKHKVLLKKAVLLDIGSSELLEIANWFADLIGSKRFLSVDEMRSRPLFCTRFEMEILIQKMSETTEQTQMIDSGEDLDIKINTYKKLETSHQKVRILYSVNQSNEYYLLRSRAQEDRMIGDKEESCPTGIKTAFQSFSINTSVETGNILRCTCPVCGKFVDAVISGGTINCPSCGASAPYAC